MIAKIRVDDNIIILVFKHMKSLLMKLHVLNLEFWLHKSKYKTKEKKLITFNLVNLDFDYISFNEKKIKFIENNFTFFLIR